ncbi:MAG TPA: hypothetical protein VKU91_06150, partial [Acidimicrobiales bacterium]|nr:hypothetical protein [Acidimicrobiales bacterium]
LASTANPYLSRTDANNVAVAGWSQGSIAASEVQDLPDMSAVKAIVALDNLRGSLRGDLGAPVNFCDGPKQGLITAVVPALGFADDYACDPGNPADVTPQSKQSGWAVWAAAGKPAVELPMAGFQHGTFTTPQLSVGELSLDWLQAWLGGQASTLSAFDACTIAGVPTTTLLASNFYSAAYLPALGLDTSDLGGQLQATC